MLNYGKDGSEDSMPHELARVLELGRDSLISCINTWCLVMILLLFDFLLKNVHLKQVSHSVCSEKDKEWPSCVYSFCVDLHVCELSSRKREDSQIKP